MWKIFKIYLKNDSLTLIWLCCWHSEYISWWREPITLTFFAGKNLFISKFKFSNLRNSKKVAKRGGIIFQSYILKPLLNT